MTEAELIKKSDEKLEQKFCPVINDHCRRDCASFEEASIKEVKSLGKTTRQFFDAWCSFVLVSGYLTVNE